MAKKFSIGDYLKAPEGVSNLDTGAEQLRYIPLDLIDPDPNNFYSLEGLEELAGNIELIGLQQPLRVRPNGERWTIVSGHRRRAAILLIRDGRKSMFDGGVPCLVDYGEASDAMLELRLIFANSATRVLSSAEQSRQAERVTELLYQLKEQGVKFPGRMRAHVAEACHVSTSKLARLHAIRERLDKNLLDQYDSGVLNESVAYALSKQPVETQTRIVEAHASQGRRLMLLTESFVADYAEHLKAVCSLKCKINKGGQCVNKDGIMSRLFDGRYDYKPCRSGKCCAECVEYLNCKQCCPLLEEKVKAEKAKRKAARKDELAAEKAQKDAAVRTVEQIWARYGQALRLAGTTDKNLRKRLEHESNFSGSFKMYMADDQIEALLDYSATDIKPSTALPFCPGFMADDAEKLCRFADALGVSLDYLFLRSERPERAEEIIGDGRATARVAPTDDKPTWFEGEPPRDGRYYARIDMGDGGFHEAVGAYRGGSWSVFNGPLYDTMQVVGWWPLPEKEV